MATLSTEYLDSAVELLRDVLRDLEDVTDRPQALAVRERVKWKMKKSVKVFTDLREEYGGQIRSLEDALHAAEVWAGRFEYLRLHIEDVRRGILTIDELAALAADMDYGDMVNIK